MPLPTRDEQVEQDRASHVFIHQHELARRALGQLRDSVEPHQWNQDQEVYTSKLNSIHGSMRQALRLLIHRCDRSTWNLTRFIQIGIIRSPRVQHTKLVTQNIAKRNSYFFPTSNVGLRMLERLRWERQRAQVRDYRWQTLTHAFMGS